MTAKGLRTGLLRLWIVISLAWMVGVAIAAFVVAQIVPAHVRPIVEIGAVAALAPPVCAIGFGWGLVWAISGFRRTPG